MDVGLIVDYSSENSAKERAAFGFASVSHLNARTYAHVRIEHASRVCNIPRISC